MPVETSEQFLAALPETKLFQPTQIAELTNWVTQSQADLQTLLAELLRRGILTQFQIKEIRFGRGKSLTFGPYVLVDLLGEGGMGRVFKARHMRLGRDVALKVIRKEKLTKQVVIERFRTEMRAMGQLSHPNVVLAFDADEADGTLYYAMEYVEGIDLTKLVQERGPVPIPLACEYIKQAAIGLQHAHDQKLVHRDIKPSNLLVTPRGQVKVLDLGLALLMAEPNPDNNRLTEHGLVLGTPDFLAPEQVREPLKVDGRADVYALGATLYYLITAKVPYEAATPADKLMKHVTAPPPSLLAVRPDAPPQLDALIQWMMAKRPEERPQTPHQAAMALAPFCPHPVGFTGQPPAAPLNQPMGFGPAMAPPAPSPFEAQAFTSPAEPGTPSTRGRQPPRARKPGGGGILKYILAGSITIVVVAAIAGIGYVLLNALSGEPPPDKEFTNSLGMKMVLIPAGSFSMGSPESEPGREAHEGPRGEITLGGPFYMSTCEVTEPQLTTVMGSSHSVFPRKMRKPASTPTDSVTWHEAMEFCQKLTQKERVQRSGWGYRLPTEAEWEYACRAGSNTPFSNGDKLMLGKHAIFDLDKELADRAVLGEADLSKPPMEKNLPHPIGSVEPNAFGLYDMHGNVWEWCHDYYATDYSARNSTDPTGPPKGDWRVLRGGSWKEPAAKCRSATRRGMSPGERANDVGFRIVYAAIKKE